MEAYKPIVDKAVAYGNAHEGSTEEKVEKTVDKMFVLFGAEILKVVIFYKKKIVIFYTEILTGKVVLWCFFTSETSEKIHNSTFLVTISV